VNGESAGVAVRIAAEGPGPPRTDDAPLRIDRAQAGAPAAAVLRGQASERSRVDDRGHGL